MLDTNRTYKMWPISDFLISVQYVNINGISSYSGHVMVNKQGITICFLQAKFMLLGAMMVMNTWETWRCLTPSLTSG